MKKGFTTLELLIDLIISIVLCFVIIKSLTGHYPFQKGPSQVKTQQQLVNEKVKEIENTNEIRKKIEQKINEEY